MGNSILYIFIICLCLYTFFSSGTVEINKSLTLDWKTNYNEFFPNKDICLTKISKLENMEPMMKAQEKELLYEGFKNSHTYFEIGSGASTFQAIKYGLKVISIESDRGWYNKMKEIFPLECDINYILIDFGTEFNLGYPVNTTSNETMYQYTHQYKHEFQADMILIDGRFRVACALNILPLIDNTTYVYIHDFERKTYHFVLKYYETIEQANTLVKLRKKDCCPTEEELQYYQKVQL